MIGYKCWGLAMNRPLVLFYFRPTFYVGDGLTEEDIGAKLEHGVLSLNIPKQEAKKLPEKKVITIEG